MMKEKKLSIEVWNRNHWIETIGDQYQVREWFEERLEDALGYFVMLQENCDNEEYRIYLHSDNEEDLSEDQLAEIADLGFDLYNDEKAWEAIRNYLFVSVVVFEYEV